MSETWQDNIQLIRDSARAIVPADRSLDRIRKARFHGAGYSREVMAQATELGWPMMWLTEENGGFGMGMREVCALMEELGAGLVPEPILSAMMAGALLQENLPEPATTGDAVIVTAWQDRSGSLEWHGGAAGSRLAGTKVFVSGAAGADLFAVPTARGVAVIHRDTAGLAIETQETLDGGYMGTLRFDDVAADFVPCGHVEAVIGKATLAHAAYLLGLSDAAFAITLDYLRIREQFGRPIGSFQSLQHRATEMKLQLELTRAAIEATARRIDTGAGAIERQQGVARCHLRAGSLAMLVAREAIQMHGAMGITDEADIGLYVRKAMTEANLFGAPTQQRRRLAEFLTEDAA